MFSVALSVDGPHDPVSRAYPQIEFGVAWRRALRSSDFPPPTCARSDPPPLRNADTLGAFLGGSQGRESAVACPRLAPHLARSPAPVNGLLAMNRPQLRRRLATILALAFPTFTPAPALENVYLTGVPDYQWHLGCFGTASGNLVGYWDRHGFPNLYTGPTAGGVAPINSFGANRGIFSLWASQAGLDGRPDSHPGHYDDYYVAYESTGRDPYTAAGRTEHDPDCTGDFIGLSQRKWSDLGGECSGNIDAYAFNFFDRDGSRRDDFTPIDTSGHRIPDVQSGLRAFSESRGYAAHSFSQLSDFNPDKPPGNGFTFTELKAEIDAGYPVLLFMQAFDQFSRSIFSDTGVNPIIHAMLAYGYVIDDEGNPYVRYRTSWASGDNQLSAWSPANWTPEQSLNLPLRGVIGYRPRPKLVGIQRVSGGLQLRWHGPQSVLRDEGADAEWAVHEFVIEKSDRLDPASWETAVGPITGLTATVPNCCDGTQFFRIRVVDPVLDP